MNWPGRVSLNTVYARMEEFIGSLWWTPHGRGTGQAAGLSGRKGAGPESQSNGKQKHIYIYIYVYVRVWLGDLLFSFCNHSWRMFWYFHCSRLCVRICTFSQNKAMVLPAPSQRHPTNALRSIITESLLESKAHGSTGCSSLGHKSRHALIFYSRLLSLVRCHTKWWGWSVRCPGSFGVVACEGGLTDWLTNSPNLTNWLTDWRLTPSVR